MVWLTDKTAKTWPGHEASNQNNIGSVNHYYMSSHKHVSTVFITRLILVISFIDASVSSGIHGSSECGRTYVIN